jgi:hypothetical protein
MKLSSTDVRYGYGSGKLRAPGGWKVQVLKRDHKALGGIPDGTYWTTIATREGDGSVQQGLQLRTPADVPQVVDRMTQGEMCADPTRVSTLGADCRAQSY